MPWSVLERSRVWTEAGIGLPAPFGAGLRPARSTDDVTISAPCARTPSLLSAHKPDMTPTRRSVGHESPSATSRRSSSRAVDAFGSYDNACRRSHRKDTRQSLLRRRTSRRSASRHGHPRRSGTSQARPENPRIAPPSTPALAPCLRPVAAASEGWIPRPLLMDAPMVPRSTRRAGGRGAMGVLVRSGRDRTERNAPVARGPGS